MMLLKDVLKMFEKDQILYFCNMNGKFICSEKVITIERNGITNFEISKNTKVDRIEFGDNAIRVFVDNRILEDDKEYYFQVIQAAEGYSSGYVKMTPEQARFVNYVTNKDNWKLAKFDSYDGSFTVNLDDWKTVEEVEGDGSE